MRLYIVDNIPYLDPDRKIPLRNFSIKRGDTIKIIVSLWEFGYSVTPSDVGFLGLKIKGDYDGDYLLQTGGISKNQADGKAWEFEFPVYSKKLDDALNVNTNSEDDIISIPANIEFLWFENETYKISASQEVEILNNINRPEGGLPIWIDNVDVVMRLESAKEIVSKLAEKVTTDTEYVSKNKEEIVNAVIDVQEIEIKILEITKSAELITATQANIATEKASIATNQADIAIKESQKAAASEGKALVYAQESAEKMGYCEEAKMDAIGAAEEAGEFSRMSKDFSDAAKEKSQESAKSAELANEKANLAKNESSSAEISAKDAASAATRAQNAADGAEDVLAHSAKTDTANIYTAPQTFNAGVSLNGGATISANELPAPADVITAGQAIASYIVSTYARGVPTPVTTAPNLKAVQSGTTLYVSTLSTLPEGETNLCISDLQDELGMDGQQSFRSHLLASMHVAMHLSYPSVWSVKSNWSKNWGVNDSPYIARPTAYAIAQTSSLLGAGCFAINGNKTALPCFVHAMAILNGASKLPGFKSQVGEDIFETVDKSRTVVVNMLPLLKGRVIDMIVMSSTRNSGVSFFARVIGSEILYHIGYDSDMTNRVDHYVQLGIGAQKHDRYAALKVSGATVSANAVAAEIVEKQATKWVTRSGKSGDKMWDAPYFATDSTAKAIPILPSWMPSTATWTMEVLAGGGTLSALSGRGQAPVTLSLSEFRGPAQYLWHVVKLTAKYNDNLTLYTHAIIQQSSL